MAIKFEIEYIFSDRKQGYYLIARSLNPEQSFDVPEKSFLNGVEIKPGIYNSRALNKNGEPRIDLFIFYPLKKSDINQFEKNMVVELIPGNDSQ